MHVLVMCAGINEGIDVNIPYCFSFIFEEDLANLYRFMLLSAMLLPRAGSTKAVHSFTVS